jgi:hypothetical protein
MFKIFRKYLSYPFLMIGIFLITPMAFMGVRNNSLMFLTWISFQSIIAMHYNDYEYNLALPISRRDLINGSYLFMLASQAFLIAYMSLTIYLGDMFFNRPMGDQLTLQSFMMSIVVLSLYGLIYHPVALYLAGREEGGFEFLVSNRYPVPLMIAPIAVITMIIFMDKIMAINAMTFTSITGTISLFNWFTGYFYSIKKIEQVDF